MKIKYVVTLQFPVADNIDSQTEIGIKLWNWLAGKVNTKCLHFAGEGWTLFSICLFKIGNFQFISAEDK